MSTPIGEISVLQGQALAQGLDGERQLSLGDSVFEDDTVSTGPDSAVEIRFSDDTVLAQGPNSTVLLDEYVYNPGDGTGNLAFDLVQGTFRSVTGSIVENSPEGFNLESPMATMGIRGTTTAHQIPPEGSDANEVHLVLQIDGKAVIVVARADGTISVLDQSGQKIDVGELGASPVVLATPEEIAYFEGLSHENLVSQQDDTQGDDEEGQEGDEGDEGDTGEGEGEGEGAGEGDGEGTGEAPGPEAPAEPIVEVVEQITLTLDTGQTITVGVTQGAAQLLEQLTGGDETEGPVVPEDDDTEDDTGGETIVLTEVDLSDESTPMEVNLEGGGNPPRDEPYYEPVGNEDDSQVTPLQTTVIDITGTEFNDDLTANEEDNTITPLAGNDYVVGGAGDDTMPFGGNLDGNDTVEGGAGTDVLSYTDAGGTNDLDNVSGIETITFGDETTSVTTKDSLIAQDATLAMDGSALTLSHTLTINATAETDGNLNITGGAGNDTITLGAGDDTVSAGAGDDSIIFGANLDVNDVVDGGTGSDSLSYTDAGGTNELDNVTGVETITFGAAITSVTTKDTLVASGSTLTVDASALGSVKTLTFDGSAETDGAFSITGGDGADTLTGGDGADTMNGGDGVDNLVGGAGNDSFTFDDTSGNDTVDGGAGDDTMDFTAVTGTVTLTMTDADSGTVTYGVTTVSFDNIETLVGTDNISGGNDNVFNGSAGADDFSGGNGVNIIYGNGGDDTLAGNNSADSVYGGADNDSLSGDNGADLLDGGSGTDVLDGGRGDDTLIGGTGADTLTGGNGCDYFRYTASGEGQDTITDFSTGDDSFSFNMGVFDAGETYNAGQFVTSADDMANTNPYFIFDAGVLYYDADGTVEGGLEAIATVQGDDVTATDITFYSAG